MQKNLENKIKVLAQSLFNFLEQAYVPAFVIFFLAPGFYINPEVLTIFWVLRKLCLAIMVFAACMLLFKSLFDRDLRRNVIVCLTLHLALLIYGLLMSLQFGGYIYFDTFRHIEYLLASVVITILLSGYISSANNKFYHSDRQIWMIAVFIIIGMIYLLADGALVFTPLPMFLFASYDAVLEYSPETSSMLILSAIYFLFLAKGQNRSVKIALFCIVLLFFSLSLYAGSRGEVIVGLIVMSGILFRHFTIKESIVMCLTLLMIIFITANVNDIIGFIKKILFIADGKMNLQASPFVERMRSVATGEHFGNRDFLLKQSFLILFDNYNCALTGCGFNYFQLHYNYEFGMYPHNFIMEMIITYGLFLGLLILATAFCGLVASLTNNYSDKFLYFTCVFLLGVAAKSGTLISISEIPVLVYFSYLGFKNANIIGRKLKTYNFLNKKFN